MCASAAARLRLLPTIRNWFVIVGGALQLRGTPRPLCAKHALAASMEPRHDHAGTPVDASGSSGLQGTMRRWHGHLSFCSRLPARRPHCISAPDALGVDVSERTVSRLLESRTRPPSQTWKTFLTNHLATAASIDFFTVPTVTGRVLFVVIVLSHVRRRIVHFDITEHPTAQFYFWRMTPTLRSIGSTHPANAGPA
jgi:hypothetical protein